MSEEHPLIKELRGIRRVVINDCYGGFGLSSEAIAMYKEKAGITDPSFYDREVARDDPYLVEVVRELGVKANGAHAHLKVVEIPADVSWHIAEYDGNEWVAEDHRTWS
jgi:hypothetical protein